MNSLRWLALLMWVAILGITGFQLYWLQQNYNREKRSLVIKTEATFRDAIFQLQTAKLNLGEMDWNKQDSGRGGKVKIFMNKDGQRHMNVNIRPRPEMISTINVIRNKLNDSLRIIKNEKQGLASNSDWQSIQPLLHEPTHHHPTDARNLKPQGSETIHVHALAGFNAVPPAAGMPLYKNAPTQEYANDAMNKPNADQ